MVLEVVRMSAIPCAVTPIGEDLFVRLHALHCWQSSPSTLSLSPLPSHFALFPCLQVYDTAKSHQITNVMAVKLPYIQYIAVLILKNASCDGLDILRQLIMNASTCLSPTHFNHFLFCHQSVSSCYDEDYFRFYTLQNITPPSLASIKWQRPSSSSSTSSSHLNGTA